MDKEDDGTDPMVLPIASTVVNLFDREKRMREGGWVLLLHKNTLADISLLTNSTSGLPGEDADCQKLNDIMRKIANFRKKQGLNLNWIDRASQEALW